MYITNIFNSKLLEHIDITKFTKVPTVKKQLTINLITIAQGTKESFDKFIPNSHEHLSKLLFSRPV